MRKNPINSNLFKIITLCVNKFSKSAHGRFFSQKNSQIKTTVNMSMYLLGLLGDFVILSSLS